jgi:hypothetical protein
MEQFNKKIKYKSDHWEEHSFDEEGGGTNGLSSRRSDGSEVKSIMKTTRTIS